MTSLHSKTRRATLATLAAFAVVTARSEDAHATLGGDVPSIEANAVALGGVRSVQPTATGERHDVVLPSGTVVHEYVSSAGAVYAISWQGVGPANLRELLGPRFAQVEGAHRSGGHHVWSFVGADLIVRTMGHRRTFAGHAWIPSLVPAGVDAGSLP
jgi:hypothetical protein